MAEQILRNLGGGKPELTELRSQIDDWVQVIDRWVERLDREMGGMTDGADPAGGPDSAPEAEPGG